MKTYILIVLLSLVVTIVTARTLLSREKRQNYDALLQNKAFVESQINCVLGRGQCDRIGHRIKILVPEVVKTKECKSCTDDERVNVEKVAEHVKNHYPKEWNEIKDQYTPEEEEEEEEEDTGIEEVLEGDGSGEEVVIDEEGEKPQKQQKQLKEKDNNKSNSQEDVQNNSSEPEENLPGSQEKQDNESNKKTSKEDNVETSTSN